MRLWLVGGLCAMAAAAAFADLYVIGSESGQALYPWRGC